MSIFRALSGSKHGRIVELAIIEKRVCQHLPKTMLAPRDLRNAALERIEFASRLIGPLSIEDLSCVPPVWPSWRSGLG